MNVRIVTTPWQSTDGDWLIVGVSEPPSSEGTWRFGRRSGGRLTRLRERAT